MKQRLGFMDSKKLTLQNYQNRLTEFDLNGRLRYDFEVLLAYGMGPEHSFEVVTSDRSVCSKLQHSKTTQQAIKYSWKRENR